MNPPATSGVFAVLMMAMVLVQRPARAQAEAAPTEAVPSASEKTGAGSDAPETPAPQPAAEPAPDSRPPPPPPPRRTGAASPNAASAGQDPYAPYNYPRYPGPRYNHLGRDIYRPFSFSLGAGPGMLSLHDDLGTSSEAGFTYGVRFGFAVAPNWNLFFSWEGAGATRDDALTGEAALFRQDAFLFGAQCFVARFLYVRAGIGFANVSEETATETFVNDGGVAGGLAVGFEFLQTPDISLGAELHGTSAQYPNERWSMGGLNLVFSFF